jgi:hypothetical protein
LKTDRDNGDLRFGRKSAVFSFTAGFGFALTGEEKAAILAPRVE